MMIASERELSALFDKQFQKFKSIFSDNSSNPSEIKTNRDLFSDYFKLLSLFVCHNIPSGTQSVTTDPSCAIILSTKYIRMLIDSLFSQMVKIESILRSEVATEMPGINSITISFIRIINVVVDNVPSLCTIIFPQISSMLSRILFLGTSKIFEDSIVEDILGSIRSFAFTRDDHIKNSLLSLLLPHILPWMKKYDKNFIFMHWLYIFKNITLDHDNIDPHKDRSEQLWSIIFHPILDIMVKHSIFKNSVADGVSKLSHPLFSTTFDGSWNSIKDKEMVIVGLLLFSNLCSIDDSHIVDIFNAIEPYLDIWFKMVKTRASIYNYNEKGEKEEEEEGDDDFEWGISSLCLFISTLSTVSPIVSQLSPKYDDDMLWCKNHGALEMDYERYHLNCYSNLKKLDNILLELSELEKSKLLLIHPEHSMTKLDDISEKNCNNSKRNETIVQEIMTKYYHKYKDIILSSFEEFIEKEAVELEEEEKLTVRRRSKNLTEEIVLCCQCLNLLFCQKLSTFYNEILLPVHDFEDLVDTFIPCMSKIATIMGHIPQLFETYCSICNYYSREVPDKCDSFLIIPTLNRILEKGSRKHLRDDTAIFLLAALKNISNSLELSIKESILSLIKPYIRDWLRMYRDGRCHGNWMHIMANITSFGRGKEAFIPIDSLCSDSWCFFDPIVDVVLKEASFRQNFIYGDRDECLRYFYNLCYCFSRPDNINDLNDRIVYIFQRISSDNLLDELIRLFYSSIYSPQRDYCGGTICGKWIKYWLLLLSIFSSIPSIVPQITPIYDDCIAWCFDNSWIPDTGEKDALDLYCDNVAKHVASSFLFNILLVTPIIHLIPSFEINVDIDPLSISSSDGCVSEYCPYYCKVHCLVKVNKLPVKYRFGDSNHRFSPILRYYNAIDGTFIEYDKILLVSKGKREETKEDEVIKHSSLIEYTPPQHILVQMPIDEERSLRQSAYDLIESTGGGVEVLFEQETSLFEEYDQEIWRKGMKDVRK
ncbi:hypothetical protein ADUPG1_007112 [Aduncisulcus paluster]|uniref:Uncharacterized protein n=1 Tax=Aduncisulcus paluster TaxID=2918883 RepID=A0ABQ5KKS2_9EUKA|nr:hypothetical protein ADUPG1_007112 [Aduncisulcus paluster]